MPNRHAPIAPSELNGEQRNLYDAIVNGPRGKGKQAFPLTDADGALNGPFGLMLYAPELGHALQDLGAAIRYRSGLSDRVREIAVLQVAVFERSEFELWAHQRLGLEAGLSQEELQAIASGDFHPADPIEEACYRLVAELNSRNDLSDDAFAKYADVIGRRGILELTVLVGYYSTLALAMRAFDVGIPVGSDDPFAAGKARATTPEEDVRGDH